MAKSKQGGTIGAVKRLCEPFLEELGLTLWDVRFEKEGGAWYLRVFIDKPEGVTIEDCEAMSRRIDKPLDELDCIEQSYCLEVCSPGLERELTRPEHFETFLGERVKVKLIRPNENGVREFKARLVGFESSTAVLELVGGEKIQVPKKECVWIKLDDFDDDDFGGIE